MIRVVRRLTITLFSFCLGASVYASPFSPGIYGTYYDDINMDGHIEPGEAIPGLSLQLYRDDGDGVFDPNVDTPIGEPVITGSMGEYAFPDLPDAGYFVQQAPTPAYLGNVTSLIRPAEPNVLIDDFASGPDLDGNNLDPEVTFSSPHHPPDSPLSGTRQFTVSMQGGVGNTRVMVDPFGLAAKMVYSTGAGVTGEARVSYDYVSDDADVGIVSPIDLTEAGKQTGLMLQIGIDRAGADDLFTLRLLGNNEEEYSEAQTTVPVTNGYETEFVFVAFSDFNGPVAPTEVFGVELELGNGEPSVDATADDFGILGPKIRNVAVTPVPEPTARAITIIGLLIVQILLRSRKPPETETPDPDLPS
ncbi:MAG: hypothetical protein GY768_15860 [Planctomycetaceae bacterium]|nr:hypothetical protein [Planctomycetaceae bacterium]